MSDYRRRFVPGGMVFLTLVAYDRRPILTTNQGRCFLRESIKKIQERRPFLLFATCLLPDHWHLVMQLPTGDCDYSTRIKRIKEEFTRQWRQAKLSEANVTQAQRKKGERGIWQPRAWEHTITDEEDLERCVDYIHWNPRKHRLVNRICDWKWSSFQRFVQEGQYEEDWGGTEPETIRTDHRLWGE